MRLDIQVSSLENELVQIDGAITVGERLVTTARLTFALRPIDDYYPPQARSLMTLLYKNFLRGAELIGVEMPGTDDA